ncbi:MAG TPA: hypothetical protein VMP13_02905, partial [Acidimicrobiia bacterium]|nr:hypothetical protein [Acidimicrobiia bacterium]
DASRGRRPKGGVVKPALPIALDPPLLVILGAALTLIGGVVSSILQEGREHRQWLRQRSEARLQDAALALGAVWNLLSRFTIDRFLMSYAAETTPGEIEEFKNEWDSLGEHVRRIAILQRAQDERVDELIRSVNLMIGTTEYCVWAMVNHSDFVGEHNEASEARNRAYELTKQIAEDLSTD